MELRIITNHVPRDVIYWYELKDQERAEFDYLDTEERQDEARFFRYRRQVYDLAEFMSCARDNMQLHGGEEFTKWDGYQSDSYFSGIVVRYVQNFERVIVGLYLS